jgi:hypothetical protein
MTARLRPYLVIIVLAALLIAVVTGVGRYGAARADADGVTEASGWRSGDAFTASSEWGPLKTSVAVKGIPGAAISLAWTCTFDDRLKEHTELSVTVRGATFDADTQQNVRVMPNLLGPAVRYTTTSRSVPVRGRFDQGATIEWTIPVESDRTLTIPLYDAEDLAGLTQGQALLIGFPVEGSSALLGIDLKSEPVSTFLSKCYAPRLQRQNEEAAKAQSREEFHAWFQENCDRVEKFVSVADADARLPAFITKIAKCYQFGDPAPLQAAAQGILRFIHACLAATRADYERERQQLQGQFQPELIASLTYEDCFKKGTSQPRTSTGSGQELEIDGGLDDPDSWDLRKLYIGGYIKGFDSRGRKLPMSYQPIMSINIR